MSVPKSKLNNTKVAASVAAGLTFVINAAIGFFGKELDPVDQSSLMNLSPIVGGTLTACIFFGWDCFGLDPETVQNERKIKRYLSRSKKDMQDKYLSAEARQKAKEDYERYKEALRVEI